MNDNQGNWRFPISDGAELRGINASFDAKFRAARLCSLAREICQNSLDAHRSNNEPVRLEFQLFDLPRQLFPGAEKYSQILTDCLDYWKKRRADKGVKDSNEIRALTLAKKTLDQSTISVLRISDHNTTGVRPSKDEWDGLIHSSGLSFKPAGANGSYGIGKAAPFACSDMLTVFYSTNTEEGDHLSQGVAHFASFTDATGTEFENVGYFCLGRNEPLPQELDLDPAFQRAPEDYGTDIYIFGFCAQDNPDWPQELMDCILSDFIYAIYKGLLEIRINDFSLSGTNLEKYMHTDRRSLRGPLLYYKVLTGPKHYYQQIELPNMGYLDLYVRINEPDCTGHVMMCRKNGMKICSWDRRRGFPSLPFEAICYAGGTILNDMLCRMETPEHTKWSPDCCESGKKHAGKQLLNQMRDAINAYLNELFHNTTVTEMDMVGAGNLLPDETLPVDERQGEKGNDQSSKEIQISITKCSEPNITPKGANDGQDEPTNAPGKPGGDESGGDEAPPDSSPSGTHSRTGGGSDGKPHKTPGDSSPRSPGDTPDERQRRRPVKLSHFRALCSNPTDGTYRMSIKPAQDGTDVALEIYLSAETERIKAPILSAAINGTPLTVNGNKITGFSLETGKTCQLDVKLATDAYYSVEVKADAAKG